MSKRLKILCLTAAVVFLAGVVVEFSTQAAEKRSSPIAVRIGEKITYAISFGKFSNVAYAELSAVSRGKLSDRDAIELHGRFKTLDFVSAAFYLIDETRTVFADAETGMPLYVNAVQNAGTMPRETNSNYLTVQAQGFDLVSMIYKLRQAGGSGVLPLMEDGKVYVVTMQVVGAERIKTDAGEFDTSIVAVQSDYFTEHGLRDVRVNLSNDEARIPAMIRLKTTKGEFKMLAASVQITEPEPAATPVLIQTPQPTPVTPRPVATATPYIDNQALAAELAFDLGETLEYRISSGGQPIGNFTFEAKERKQFDGRDSLLLKAAATRSEPGNRFFAAGDGVNAVVSPETLAPRRAEIKFSGTLSSYNQLVQFDTSTGAVSFNGPNTVDSPIGTHSVLSLFYALRSFNLKPSKDPKNPVNDTRVAVFWENQPYIFTLRPSEPQVILVQGQKVAAQMISITTQNTYLDQLSPKIWISIDERRVPLRFSFGSFEGELITTTIQTR
ncbi:MAG: DUF3108 domain-containing protein [Acidobacteriota bacterium]